MRRRIIASMGANSFGMAINIGMQLVSLPLFLHFWDTATYGVWLMLSAIPSYLSMADVGMVTAAGNKMTMALGKGDAVEANKVFQTAQMFMLVVCATAALLVIPAVLFAPVPSLSTQDQRIALAALCAGVLVALCGGLVDALFKATQRYAFGAMLANCVRLGEWMGGALGLLLVGSFSAVAIGGLLARIIGTLMGVRLSQKNAEGVRWGVHNAAAEEARAMIKPAMSFMVFPLANALSFQGITLLVGAIFGPISVALFNTYRTIARVAVQITSIFSHALWPEFSRLFGEGATLTLHKLFQRSVRLGALQALVLSVMLYFVSPWLLSLWTHGRIDFVPATMFWMLLYAATASLWHVPRVLLMAINQHTELAYWTLALAALSIGLAWFLGKLLLLNGVVIAMLLSEFFIAVVCTWLAYSFMSGNHGRKAVLL